MKALVSSSILACLLCAVAAGCSSTNSTTNGVTPSGGSGNTASGGTLSLGGGGSPAASAGTLGLGGGDPPPGGGGAGGACQTGGAEFVPKVPTVMLLVDRSGTMFDQQGNPWNTLRDGVLPVVKDLNDQVRFGFISITGEMGSKDMCPLLDEVPAADKNYDAIAAKYTALMRPQKGESPGMLGLQKAYELLLADKTDGDKYVLFVTDGEQDYCGDGNHLCPTDSVVYWLQKLKAANVSTFVFGLPLANSGDQLSYGAILQAFANAGAGQPVKAVLDNASQTPGSIWDQCHPGGDTNAAGWLAEFTAAAKVDDPLTADIDESKTLGNYATLGGTATVFKPDPTDQAALAEQFRKVLAGVKSCTFDIGGDIKVVQSLLSEAHVFIEGVEVPLDLNKTNGWYMPMDTQIELVGDACTNWRMPGKNKISWDFPCKILVPVVK